MNRLLVVVVEFIHRKYISMNQRDMTLGPYDVTLGALDQGCFAARNLPGAPLLERVRVFRHGAAEEHRQRGR